MKPHDITQISQAYKSGELTEEDFYTMQAMSEAAEMSEFKFEGIATLAAAFLGFSFLGTTGGLGALLIGGALIWDKLKAGDKAALDIDAGNIAPYLPAAERPYYEQAKQRALKANPTQAEPKPVTPQKTIAATPTTTLPAEQLPELNLDELRHYPSIIIFGAQGSGKTSLARAIATDRQVHDHEIIAFDPHGIQWAQFPVIGAGMDYGAIGSACISFKGEVDGRYKQALERQKEAIAARRPQAEIEKKAYAFASKTIIADEFTNWSDRLDSNVAVEFLRRAWTDTRKIKLHTIFISHANTIEGGLAGARGLSALRDSGCFQIELFTKSVKGEAVPTGDGLLYRPGQAPVKVRIPNPQNLNVQNPGSSSGQNTQVQGSEPLNPPEPVEEPRSNVPEPEPEPTLNPHANGLSERDRALLLRAKGMSIDDIIFQLWEVKKGGSKRYQEGREKLRLWIGN